MIFTDKLKLAKLTYEQYADWMQRMVYAEFYDRLHRQVELVWKHIHSSGSALETSLQHSESDFVQNYNNIKDSTWPDIHGYKDFKMLPDNIQHECMSHGLSIKRWTNNIVKRIHSRQPDQRLTMCIPVIKFVMENMQYIKNKTVMLFNEPNGKMAGAMLHNQCQSLTVLTHQKFLYLLQRNLDTYFADHNVTYHDMDQHHNITAKVDTVMISPDMFRWGNLDWPTVNIHDVVRFNPRNIIVEHDRAVNDKPIDVDTPTINNYNLIHKHNWIFQITNDIEVQKEICIYEITNK